MLNISKRRKLSKMGCIVKISVSKLEGFLGVNKSRKFILA